MNSIEFLSAFHPNGPWVITAIAPNRKGIEVKTFGPSTKTEAEAFIAANNTKRNLYFNVNVPMGEVTKKTSKTDIDLVPWLHVDIDPRAREDNTIDPVLHLEREMQRIHYLVTEKCPTVQPTVIVFSGGGYQLFWKLKLPLGVGGNIEEAEDIARYNKQLELIYGGDNCHNVDRIMRLPGTLNIPDAKKMEKGRIPKEAFVVMFRPELEYDIKLFTQAPKLQENTITIGGDHTVKINTGNIDRLGSVEDLNKYNVNDRVKVIIVQGYDPDNPKPNNTRSEWLFDAVCQMLRANVPHDVIFSVITDPEFRISASVLDKKDPEKYASRQIQRAIEFIEEPWLAQLNDRFIVIGNIGGKCRVIEHFHDSAMERSRISYQTFGDFKNRFSNQRVAVGKKEVPVGQWWLNHPKRRQAETISFCPGKSVNGAYNLWQGFACEPIPGTGHELYLEHVKQNICCNNEDHYKYLIGWLARSVQHPNELGETAIVLRGKSGTGKSFFVQWFGALWGRHFLQVSNAKHLIGEFNSHLRDCVILFGDEAFYAGDKKHESVLKTLITTNEINIEAKGVDIDPQPNYLHLMLASNSEWVVPTGPMERRFFVLDVGDARQRDNIYFKAIATAMESGGQENLLHYLLTYDLNGFDIHDVPMTHALMEQKVHSLGPLETWWLGKLVDKALLPHHERWMGEVSCDALIEDYIQMCVRFGIQRRGSAVRVGLFLEQMCPDGWPKRIRKAHQGARRYVYMFPSLEDLRQHWDRLYGKGFRWGDGDSDATTEPAVF